jgi:hypothetical protein
VLEQQKFDVNDCANEKKQTPLLWAAAMGRAELAFILHEHGAYLDYVDFDGFSAVGLAVQNGHCLLAHVLFELGAVRQKEAKYVCKFNKNHRMRERWTQTVTRCFTGRCIDISTR